MPALREMTRIQLLISWVLSALVAALVSSLVFAQTAPDPWNAIYLGVIAPYVLMTLGWGLMREPTTWVAHVLFLMFLLTAASALGKGTQTKRVRAVFRTLTLVSAAGLAVSLTIHNPWGGLFFVSLLVVSGLCFVGSAWRFKQAALLSHLCLWVAMLVSAWWFVHKMAPQFGN